MRDISPLSTRPDVKLKFQLCLFAVMNFLQRISIKTASDWRVTRIVRVEKRASSKMTKFAAESITQSVLPKRYSGQSSANASREKRLYSSSNVEQR